MRKKDCEYYLRDLVLLLKNNSFKAKEEKNASPSKDLEYNLGYLMAYHDVISLMKQQAITYEIDQKEIGLADIEPERDLL